MTQDDRDVESTRRAVLQKLQSLQRAGVTHLPVPDSLPPAPRRAATQDPRNEARIETPPAETPPAEVPPTEAPADSAMSAESTVAKELDESADSRKTSAGAEARGAKLQVIRAEVAACTRCPELVSSRKQTVFGVGSPQARLCFLGEAPGADEDRVGEPFVGRAGQLLNKIITACTLNREDVYILNVLKCRPPGNRNPAQEEVRDCRGYFERQLDIIQPEFLCCLGGVAAQALLETDLSVGRLRGRFHDYRGMQVVVTYHPSYLLRNESAKRHTWDDMKMLMKAMGVEL